MKDSLKNFQQEVKPLLNSSDRDFSLEETLTVAISNLKDIEFFQKKLYKVLWVGEDDPEPLPPLFHEISTEEQAKRVIITLGENLVQYIIDQVYSIPSYKPKSRLEVEIFRQILKNNT